MIWSPPERWKISLKTQCKADLPRVLVLYMCVCSSGYTSMESQEESDEVLCILCKWDIRIISIPYINSNVKELPHPFHNMVCHPIHLHRTKLICNLGYCLNVVWLIFIHKCECHVFTLFTEKCWESVVFINHTPDGMKILGHMFRSET